MNNAKGWYTLKMQIMSFPQVYGYEVVEKVGVGSFSVVYKAYRKVVSRYNNINTHILY